MKVSIIIPVYNVEDYLEECLNSAVNQTLNDIEIICINDGSIDSSLEILNRYKNKYKNIKVVSQKNQGLSASRNVGIKMSTGKYIYFLDSDDFIDLECMEKCYKECEKYKLDIVTFDAECFYDRNYNGPIMIEEYDRSRNLESRVYTGRDFYITSNNNGAYRVPTWLNFYRKKFIEDNNLFFIDGILHEDEVHTCKSLLAAKNVKYIKDKFFKRRYRNDSIMTSKINLKRIESNMILAEDINKLRLTYYKEDKELSRILKNHINRFLKNVIVYCDSLNLYNERKFFIDRIRKMEIDIDIDLDLNMNIPMLYYNLNNISKKKRIYF